MNLRSTLAFCLVLTPAWSAFSFAAPAASANPVSDSTRTLYKSVKNNIMKSAEEMPASGYGFKPVDTVRTFGQLIAHVADGQYEFCSALSTSKEKNPEVEKTAKDKGQILEALKTAFSYCDAVYDSLTDDKAVKTISFFGRPYAAVSVLDFNTAHNNEHYGNLVTYLRMKGLVPPSSKQ